MDLRTTLRAIAILSILTAPTVAHPLQDQLHSRPPAFGELFIDFIARTEAMPDTASRRIAVDDFAARAAAYGRPIINDSTVSFFHLGRASRVSVPGDLNGWNPAADTMHRIEGTDFFYLSMTVDTAARFEYKLAVDSTWVLDPYNPQQSMGGFGPNSEVRMPGYTPPRDIAPREGISHGSVDTLSFRSRILHSTHPVLVYTPAGYRHSRRSLPVIYVANGGEYLSLALMKNVLDNLIAEGRIMPVVGVFLVPRTDINDPRTSTAMKDYAMSDDFVRSLVTELRPRLMREYRLRKDPAQTAIMGSSLGGLIATYAAFTRPDVFGLCAAQSPAYWLEGARMITTVEHSPRKDFRMYLDTGTFHDAEQHARPMRDAMRSKGYLLHYEEHPEGHSWANWRARLGTILAFFWGIP